MREEVDRNRTACNIETLCDRAGKRKAVTTTKLKASGTAYCTARHPRQGLSGFKSTSVKLTCRNSPRLRAPRALRLLISSASPSALQAHQIIHVSESDDYWNARILKSTHLGNTVPEDPSATAISTPTHPSIRPSPSLAISKED